MWDPTLHETHPPSPLPSSSAIPKGESSSFPFRLQANLEPLEKIWITPLLNLESSGHLTELLQSCLTREGNFSVDFGELELTLKLTLISIFEHSTVERAEDPLKKLLINKIAYVAEISEHLQQDIDELSKKFLFQKEEIESIHFSFPAADTHNNGKSPVFITFTLKNNQEIKWVYKPRNMFLEKMVCDADQSLFCGMNRDPRNKIIVLPTYKILPIEDHGYSEFVEGKVLYNEEATSSINFGDIDASFMRINRTIVNSGHYLTLLGLRKKLKQSDEGNQLLANPRLLEHEDFCNTPEISEILNAIKTLSDPINDPETALEIICNPKRLANLSFFGNRDPEQLQKDYLLFRCLKHINAVDLHAANFIASPPPDESLFPVDLECFDHEACPADEILPLIEIVYEAREIDPPLEAVENLEGILSDYVREFEEIKRETPIRYLPLATMTFEEMQASWLRGESKQIQQTSFLLMELLKEKGFDFDVVSDFYRLEREVISCFNQFEIPYFLLHHNQLILNGKPLCTKVEEKDEKEKKKS